MLGGEVGKERERDETRAMIIAVGGRGRNISLPRFSLEMSSEEGEGEKETVTRHVSYALQ